MTRRRLLLVALLGGAACAAPLRAADRAQAVPRNPATARVQAAGVTLDLTAGDERGWLGALPPGLMPVEVTIHNESGAPIRVRADELVLALPNGVRKRAIDPGQMWSELRRRVPGIASAQGLPTPGRATDRTALSLIYAWPGLRGSGPVALDERLRPDPRPRPEGVLENGGAASTIAYFEVDPSHLKSFALDVSVEGEDGRVLGTASAPFTR